MRIEDLLYCVSRNVNAAVLDRIFCCTVTLHESGVNFLGTVCIIYCVYTYDPVLISCLHTSELSCKMQVTRCS